MEFTMQRLTVFTGAILSITSTLLVAGCGQSNSANKSASNSATGGPKTETASPEAPQNTKSKWTISEKGAETTKALTELPREARAWEKKKKVCRVSGGALGKRGPPLKMEVKGQTV